jgi:hypothetical protein
MVRKGWRKESYRHQLASRGITSNEQVTNRQLIYGDFDKDGILNIDDAKPFDAKQHGMAADFPISKDFIEIEEKANSHIVALSLIEDEMKDLGYQTKSRIKSLHSIVNKLKSKHLDEVKDFAGLLVFVKDEKEARKIGNHIEQKFNVVKSEDFFKKPGAGRYQALHYDIEILGKPVEVQINTKASWKKAQEMHSKYKMGEFSGGDINEKD